LEPAEFPLFARKAAVTPPDGVLPFVAKSGHSDIGCQTELRLSEATVLQEVAVWSRKPHQSLGTSL
jgi:hypothetical protein